MSDEIVEILDGYKASVLREMAEAASLNVKDRSGKALPKDDLVRKMQAEFFTAERVRAAWARLDERERAVVNRLLLHGGAVNTKSLRRELLRARLVSVADAPERYSHNVPYAAGYVGNPHRPHSRVFEDVLARLTLHGLVFSSTTVMSSGNAPYKMQLHPGATLYIPQAVRRCLPEPTPVADPTQDWQPARVTAGEPALLLRDLYLYWDFVRRNEVALIQAGLVGKRWLKAINQVLLSPDPTVEDARREDDTPRLYLLRRLLESLKLVKAEKGVLRSTHADPLHTPAFWSQPTFTQLSACLEAWRGLGVHLGSDVAQYGPRYDHAVQVTLEALKSMRADFWYEPEDLLERMQMRDADFLFPEHTRVENYSGSWYYGYTGGYYYGHPKELLAKFEQKEREFIRRCVQDMLHALGMVELGFNAENAADWVAFRLTPAGKAMLDDAPPPQAAPSLDDSGRLIIQPNFQLIAMGPVSLSTLAQLDLFAERESADRGAFQYRLSRESIYRAQQLGLGVSDVLRFLEQVGEVELPQNVRRSLEEWAAQHERIVFRTGVTLVQTADADLLGALMNASPVGKYLARPVTPTVAVARSKRRSHLIGALIEQGLFPAVSGAEPASADHSVIVHADGTIRSVHAVPSLHLRGRLERLAEELGNGAWKLTPASIGRAGGSKGKVLGILDELQRLQRGTLPETLVTQIRAWGGYFGQAAAETLTLIEFRDQAALDELRAIPELRDWLTPFPAGSRALAVLPGDKLAQVTQTLARLGVQVREGFKKI
jgi:hypothetical protein